MTWNPQTAAHRAWDWILDAQWDVLYGRQMFHSQDEYNYIDNKGRENSGVKSSSEEATSVPSLSNFKIFFTPRRKQRTTKEPPSTLLNPFAELTTPASFELKLHHVLG